MTTIYADFNARTPDDRVRLSTAGSRASIAASNVGPGSWVWLSDGDVRVGALIEEARGELLARVAWNTSEVIIPADAVVASDEITKAIAELQALMQREDRDHRRVLDVLPLAERRLQPGRADYVRSRAAQAFGHPHLALLAIEDALSKAGGTPGFLHQRLELLKGIDLDRALLEAKTHGVEPSTSAVVLAACAGVLSAKARTLDEAGMLSLLRELIAVTDRFDSAPGHEIVPPSARAMVHLTRGFAFLHLGDRSRAIPEFSSAISANPISAEAWAARGLETYPDRSAVSDLERAIDLQTASYWPAYYLAHHYVHHHDWPNAERFAGLGLSLEPPPRVIANLLEWEAIARFQQGGDFDTARDQLRKALELAPDNEHLRSNLLLLDALHAQVPSSAPAWDLRRDAEKQTAELQAA